MSVPALRYLIDTGWVIRHLRGRTEYTMRLAALASSGLAVSVVTLAELLEGVERSSDPGRARVALDAFMAGVQVLPAAEDTARAFGELSAQMRAAGNHPGDFDVLIAATAIEHGLIVLTTDVDDFSRFPNLQIITTP